MTLRALNNSMSGTYFLTYARHARWGDIFRAFIDDLNLKVHTMSVNAYSFSELIPREWLLKSLQNMSGFQ